jgi:hypothetical protein
MQQSTREMARSASSRVTRSSSWSAGPKRPITTARRRRSIGPSSSNSATRRRRTPSTTTSGRSAAPASWT